MAKSVFEYDIRAMLRKFGVVTVMDVKAYKTELFTADQEANEDEKKCAYNAGEWDALSLIHI